MKSSQPWGRQMFKNMKSPKKVNKLDFINIQNACSSTDVSENKEKARCWLRKYSKYTNLRKNCSFLILKFSNLGPLWHPSG